MERRDLQTVDALTQPGDDFERDGHGLRLLIIGLSQALQYRISDAHAHDLAGEKFRVAQPLERREARQ